METFLEIIFFIFGLIVGVRIGLRGLVTFWFMVGLIYLLIKIPLGFYKVGAQLFYGIVKTQIADAVTLIALIIFVLLGGFAIAYFLYEEFGIHELPEGLDRAFGGALGGALGWILVSIIM